MAIKFTWAKLPVDESGKAYESLEAFQAAEIAKLLPPQDSLTSEYADQIVQHKAEIIEILELTESARPTARGVKKPRKAKQNLSAQGEPSIQSLGGKARSEALTAERKTEIAKNAANARWHLENAALQDMKQ